MAIVLLQSLLILAIAGWVTARVYRQDRRAPIDAMGVAFLAVLALYTVAPSLLWVFLGGSYDDFRNVRLFRLQPSAQDIQAILNIALAYAAGFAFFYAPRRVAGIPCWHQPISRRQMLVAVGIWAGVHLSMVAL